MNFQNLRVAIVHDWLVTYGGAEKVLEALLALFPRAQVFTLLHQPGTQSPLIESRRIHTSSLQRLPLRNHRPLIALMPYAAEQFDLRGFDLVISNTFAVTQGVITSPEQLHLAYVNRTMRYAWDTYHDDLAAFGITGGVKRLAATLGYHYLRLWDQAAFQRPDLLVANSPFSARRIRKYYHRQAQVLFPPVEVERFSPAPLREDYYVTVGRLVPLKGADIMVRACTQSGRRLVVVGDGPQSAELRRLASPTVQFTGKLDTAAIASLLSRARGYLALAEEEFGIANVEALASGCPVVAWGQGGVQHTVDHGETGWLFAERSVQGLHAALDAFERATLWPAERIAQSAQRFSEAAFRQGLSELIQREWTRWQHSEEWT